MLLSLIMLSCEYRAKKHSPWLASRSKTEVGVFRKHETRKIIARACIRWFELAAAVQNPLLTFSICTVQFISRHRLELTAATVNCAICNRARHLLNIYPRALSASSICIERIRFKLALLINMAWMQMCIPKYRNYWQMSDVYQQRQIPLYWVYNFSHSVPPGAIIIPFNTMSICENRQLWLKWK